MIKNICIPFGAPLPHNCNFCKKYHKKLRDEPGIRLPKRDEWNLGRRIHNYICRREEDTWLQNAVNEGNIQATEIYLSQRNRGNKNLIDLLPFSTF